MIIKKIVQHTAMLTIAAAVSISASSVYADSVNYIIPFGPGGESDVSARMQQSFYKEKFGDDLVISYKPGGGGAAGWASLNGLNGDGQTIMGINLPHIVIKPAQKDVGFIVFFVLFFELFLPSFS